MPDNYYGPYSHSRIETYQKCPAKFKYDYIDKLPVPAGLPTSPSMERGTLIHKSVENFLLHKSEQLHPDIHGAYGQFFFSLRENYACFPEYPFAVNKEFYAVPPDHPNVWFRGFFDLKLLPNNAGPVEQVIIYEFKTGQIYESEHGSQRDKYALMALLQHPEAESVVVWGTYLDKQEIRKTELHRSQINMWKDILRGEVSRIEKDSFFMTRPEYRCRWCPRSRYNGGGPCQF